MTRTHIILFMILFLCLEAQGYSSPFLSTENSTTTPKYAGTSGVIDIKKDSQGFYVEADTGWYPFGPHQPQPDPSPLETAKWMISLSNSETMAGSSNCLNFSNYDYTKSNWDYNMWETTISYPNFITTALAGYSYILMDKKYWSMTDYLFVPKADSCSSKGNASIGSDRYGVLGFGTLDRGAKNFKTSKNFSVYIKPDLSAGKLLFNNETSNYTTSSKALYNLSSDVNWRLSFPQGGQIQVRNSSANFKNSYLMFDINSDAIGLPNDLYESFLGAFIKISGIVCSYDLYKPECKYTGNIQDLPDIFLSFNDTKIKIPPRSMPLLMADLISS